MSVACVLPLVTQPGEEPVSGFGANSPTTAKQNQPAVAFALLLCPDTASANRTLLRNHFISLLCSPEGFDRGDVYVEQPILQALPLPYCCRTETRRFMTHPLQMEVNFWAKKAGPFAVVYHACRWSQLVFSLPTPLQWMASKVPSLLFWDHQATEETVSQNYSARTADACHVDGQAPEKGELITSWRRAGYLSQSFLLPGGCARDWKLSTFLAKSPLSPIKA